MYQISFEDVARLHHLSKQPGRTAFIDESGSFGFDYIATDNSPTFVLAAVIVKNSAILPLRERVESIRARYFPSGEITSRTIGHDNERRLEIFKEILPLDFKAIVLVADKSKFTADSPEEAKNDFIQTLNRRLYAILSNAYPLLNIVESQSGFSEFQDGFKKYVKTHAPQMNLMNEYDLDYIENTENSLTQIADMIAGCVRTQLEDAAPDFIDMLRGKTIFDSLPESFRPCIDTAAQDASFNLSIYETASRRAADYIAENEESPDEDLQLQLAFLRCLLFEVRHVSATRFISSEELLTELSKYTHAPVSSTVLYHRIAAPLRDAGLILSSSPHGYKIPVSVDDIYSYLYRIKEVSAMVLNHIDSCRKAVLICTDNRIDILNASDFVKYKEYFK